ncbi:hypothetical protein GGQ71_003630 [Rhizobium taibaishanense]|nr:hypothetical protein [Allorhizobium taibaishanense]
MCEYANHRILSDIFAAYNFGRRLKTVKGLTPYEFIVDNGLQSQKSSASIQSINSRTKQLEAMQKCYRATAT